MPSWYGGTHAHVDSHHGLAEARVRLDFLFTLTFIINSSLYESVVSLESFFALNQTEGVGSQRHAVWLVQCHVLLFKVTFATKYGRLGILKEGTRIREAPQSGFEYHFGSTHLR